MATARFDMAGTRALVTGGSSGLGPAIVRALSEAGARVAIQYHQNQSGAESLAESLHTEVVTLQADLGDESSVNRLFQDALAALGEINLLVNCAAVESQSVADLAGIDMKRWQATQQANVGAPMRLMQCFAAQGQSGSIINISSIEGRRPAPGHAHYSVSKAALEMLTQSAALEFGPQGVRVNAIAPGLIWREGIEQGWPEGFNAWCKAAPLGRLVQPDEIADAVLFLASDSAASISGTTLTIDCGLSVRPGWS